MYPYNKFVRETNKTNKHPKKIQILKKYAIKN
jgi:hypothetical protein